MRYFSRDFRHGLRTLARNPGFTVVAVLMLALGIGANGVVASVLRALLSRPLPYSEPERLVMIWSRWQDYPKTWVSVSEYRNYSTARGFAGLALFAPGKVNLTTRDSQPERIGNALISANLFDVLGVRPILGRVFTATEVGTQPANVVILSEELWRRRFGGRSSILGTAVDISGVPKTVVGVMPAGCKLPLDYSSASPSALWMPLDEELRGPPSIPRWGGEHNYYAVGRLRPGTSIQQAHAELRSMSDGLTASGVYPREWHFEPLVIPLLADILGDRKSVV